MPLIRNVKTENKRRARPAHPSCRGGASSLLRLTTGSAQRLPTALDLSDWVSRAASVMLPVTGPLAEFGGSGR